MKTRVSVELLHLGDDGSIAITDQHKADVLNIYFCSVFTKEDLANIPVINDIYSSSPIIDIPLPDEAIYKKLSQLDPSKSPGPHEWHPKFVKEAAEQLVTPLQILFRKFLDSGFIPNQWKTANVIESLIRDAVIDYLLTNGLLTKEQHGFMPGRSCVTQLLTTLESWIALLFLLTWYTLTLVRHLTWS